MSERTTTLRLRSDVAADMDEADRLAALAKAAMRAVEGLTLDPRRLTATATTSGALASLATFYAVRATWTHGPTDKED